VWCALHWCASELHGGSILRPAGQSVIHIHESLAFYGSISCREGDFLFVGPQVFDQLEGAKREVELPEYLANSRFHKASRGCSLMGCLVVVGCDSGSCRSCQSTWPTRASTRQAGAGRAHGLSTGFQCLLCGCAVESPANSRFHKASHGQGEWHACCSPYMVVLACEICGSCRGCQSTWLNRASTRGSEINHCKATYAVPLPCALLFPPAGQLRGPARLGHLPAGAPRLR